MPLTFADVDARVQQVIAAQPQPAFNVNLIPHIGRHFTRALAQQGIFSSVDLVRVAAALADPAANMNASVASRRVVLERLKDFVATLTEAPRGARCVPNFYDAAAAPGNRTYLVRDVNPAAFWAIIATLAWSWPDQANQAVRHAAIVALTGGAARFLRRAHILGLQATVLKPRAVGARSNAAAASCVCRRNAASCGAAQAGGAALCQWLEHGLVAQGLPNWPAALAGVCLPHPNLNVGSAEALPGRTRAVEPVPYPPAGQAANAALMGAGGAANAHLARYTRRGASRQFRNFY
jgi:hypothetical protein